MFGAFQRIGWGPAVNQPHDLGTDLWVAARDARRFDLGMVVGVQVKAGSSWFSEPALENDQLLGWWFRDSETHFKYWLGHGIPHLVVLYNLEEQIAYWVHVTHETAERTGVGWKILVPKVSTVDQQHLEELIDVAATGRAGLPWEGSIWLAGAAIPASDHLRHALMVPRLIAPHPNAGYAQPISPGQAVAMLMQARLRELHIFAERFAEVPQLVQAGDSPDWEWRLAHALYERVIGSQPDPLVARSEDATSPAHRASAAVAAASALIEIGRSEEAIEVLDPVIESDRCSPVDHNWLLVQRARARAEIGLVAEARQDAIEAQATRSLAPSDATAGAVSAASAVLLFNTGMPGARDVESVVTNSDTAAGWWRSQVTSRGLGASLERWFDSWADDRSTVTFGGQDISRNQLAAAALTASHIGDQVGWRNLSGWQAVDQLVRLPRHDNPADASEQLSALRLAGDEKSLVKAIKHLRSDGPARAVTDAGRDIDLKRATRTTALANLRFLHHGGDLLEPQCATAAVRWILATLCDPEPFVQRTSPSYLVLHQLIETLSGLVRAAEPGARREVAETVLGLPSQEHQILATAWARVLQALPESAWRSEDAAELETNAAQHHFPLPDVLRGVAADLGDENARQYLLGQVKAGSLDALATLSDVSELDPTLVEAQVASLASSVTRMIADAHKGMFGIGSDVCHPLALLNLWHPDLADWRPVVELLRDDAVPVDGKRQTLTLLAYEVERIPEDVRGQLVEAAEPMVGGGGNLVPTLFQRPRDAAAEATFLTMALGAFDADEAAEQVMALLEGKPEDRHWAAVIAGRADTAAHRGFLISLSTDQDPHVRAAACAGLARGAARDFDPLIVAALKTCASDPGTAVAMQLGFGLKWLQGAEGEPARQLAAELRIQLQRHPSARVRLLAEK